MRVLLVTGKGGVGKTTIAAASALHAARCGVKTLVLSADVVPSLGDCLAVPLGGDPVEVEPGLSAAHVDTRARAERSGRAVLEDLVGVLDLLGLEPPAADGLTALPGVGEVLALLEVRDLVQRTDHDLVVIDGPPSAETLRLLALPEALSRCLDQALPMERRLRRAMAAAARGDGPPPQDHLVEAADRLRTELTGVREALAAPQTSVRLVLTPEAVVLADARRTLTALALHGYPVDGVVANRMVPAGRDPWRAGWAREQARLLAQAEPVFRPAPVARAGYAAAEPRGIDALAALGVALYGPPGPGGATALLRPPPPSAQPRVERDGAEYEWVIPLPAAEREQLSLARIDDDLWMQVAGHRRVLSLPSGLRRCIVLGARLVDGALRVRFRPDPALWRAP